jgi:hypothetical protein
MVLNTSQISKLFSFINNLGVVKTPALAGAGVGGGIHFDNLINVEGSVDEKVIPDLRIITDNVLQKLESIIYKRGSSRV